MLFGPHPAISSATPNMRAMCLCRLIIVTSPLKEDISFRADGGDGEHGTSLNTEVRRYGDSLGFSFELSSPCLRVSVLILSRALRCLRALRAANGSRPFAV